MNREKIKDIGLQYNELLNSCKPFITREENIIIDNAFKFASDFLLEKTDELGNNLLEHSLKIARTATDDLGLGARSIIAALLHNTITESGVNRELILGKFDKTTLALIEGYDRISALPTDKVTLQSHKFRQLFLSVADDIRIILLKVAHRLNDMRTLSSLPEPKRIKFSNEVEYLYIPIAHRLGLYRVKSELEDLLMQYRNPEQYASINERIDATKAKRELFIREFAEPIEKELFRNGFEFDIKGRPKSIPSIWDKMKKKDVGLDQVYDLFAIRIIIDSQEEKEKSNCWKIYSIVTNIYPPNPKRLRDWITTPKASGYESLHTTVKGPNDKWVEVQIRTRRMDESAEKGQAAHWRYKGFGEKEQMDQWLQQVRDILENPEQIKFDENFEKNRKPEIIFVYTPAGDLVDLPYGATVLDFAYSIHSRVGDRCIGAKVNGNVVQIRHELKSGDRVEISTSKNQKPKLDWLGFVKTSKAKNKIKRSIKEQKYQLAEIGSDILKRRMRNWKIQYKDDHINFLVKHYKLQTSIDLYDLIAEEKLDLNEIRSLLRKKIAEAAKPQEKKSAVVVNDNEIPEDTSSPDILIIDNKLDKVNYRLAKCCNPIPGDPVFGFVTIGKGITIHSKRCPNAKRLLEKYGYRRIPVKWKESEDVQVSFIAYIRVLGEDRIGMLGEITNVISNDLKVNMLSIKVDSKDGQFTGEIKVNVKDNIHLDELLHKISKIKGILRAVRIASK